MATKDPRVDAYIAKSADFAKPILNHVRKLVHAACPEVQETLKWSMPHFLHKGILLGVAGFKNSIMRCISGKGGLVLRAKEYEGGMGQFGRITALSDLPGDKVLLGYIKKAVELNEAGVKKAPRKPRPKTKLVVPPDFAAALNKDKKALATFENFSPSHKREYLEWITEAKRAETREKRIKTTLQWLAQGKSRNWKYLNC